MNRTPDPLTPDGGRSPPLSPDEAFTVLGNETRMAILQTLLEADGPLSFSDLRVGVAMSDSGQFNYHLSKLDDHFIEKTNQGYVLRQAGRRVVEAVLSGAITESPLLEPTPIDFECLLCGAPIEVSYAQERLELFCTECPGIYGGSGRVAMPDAPEQAAPTENERAPGTFGYIGKLQFPPAGLRDRTPEELLDAASTWTHLELFSAAHDICPRCSAVVDHSVSVCDSHDASDGLCATCQRRYAVQLTNRCRNCRFGGDGVIVTRLLGDLDLRLFVGEHGIDPLAEGIRWGWAFEEEIISVEPFEAKFTFTIDGDAITLTVDDELTVTDVYRSRDRDSG